MMYYRVAIWRDVLPGWQWKTTVLSSLDALLRVLQLYKPLPQNHLRVFSSSSREDLNEQFARENQGLESYSITAEQFLQERKIGSVGSRRITAKLEIYDRRKTITLVDDSDAPSHASSNTRDVLHQPQRSMYPLEQKRLEIEQGAGGDHDQPYTFTLPLSMPQVLTWAKLLVRVQQGELEL